MLQNSTKKTLFGLSIGAHHGVSNRTIFEPPSGTDDAGHWRSAGRIRMYVNVVFYNYPPPATMAHTLHPLTPLFLSSTLLTVYMEMRLSLQKLLFADIPFVRWLLFHDEPKRRRGWWYDSDLRILTNFSPEALCTFVLVSTAAKKKHRVFPTFRWDMTIIRKHRNVL